MFSSTNPSASFFLASTCAESVLFSSPDSSPELQSASCFSPPSPAQKAAQKASRRERTKRRETLCDKDGWGLSSVQEESDSDPTLEQEYSSIRLDGILRPRFRRMASSPKTLPSGRVTQRTTSPTTPPSSGPFNRNLSFSGRNSPLGAFSNLSLASSPKKRSGSPPSVEVNVYPRRAMFNALSSGSAVSPYEDVPGMVASSGSDDDEGSDSGSCCTPLSASTFSSHDGMGDFQARLFRTEEEDGEEDQMTDLANTSSFAVLKRRTSPISPVPIVSSVSLARKEYPGRGDRNLPLSKPAALPFNNKRHFSLPSLAQIQRRVASHQQRQDHPAVPLRSYSDSDVPIAPTISITTPEDETKVPFFHECSNPTSRLPPFLLARRQQQQQDEQQSVLSKPDTSFVQPRIVVPTFTVTPPPERAEGSRRVREMLGVGQGGLEKGVRERRRRSLGVEWDRLGELKEEEEHAESGLSELADKEVRDWRRNSWRI